MATALMLGAIASGNEMFMGELRSEGKPYPKPADHPKWKVGEHIIYAKNAKDAEKYAKKRGLWREGYKVEPTK